MSYGNLNLQKLHDIVNNNYDQHIKSKQFYMNAERILKRREGLTWCNKDGWHIFQDGKICDYTPPKLEDTGRMPWVCPKCQKPLNSYADKQVWKAKGYCHSCFAKLLTQMKLNGTYLLSTQIGLMNNYLAYAKDAKAEIRLHKFDVLVLKKNVLGNMDILKWSNDLLLMENFKQKWIKLILDWESKINLILIPMKKELELKNKL